MEQMAPGYDFEANMQRPYNDVLDAWRAYLQHDNGGRGVVLIGHSQGAELLRELVKKEIDGKPIQQKLVSAILLGADIHVPRGRFVGGSFDHIPLCASKKQTGCVVAYSTFLASAPPDENTQFGRNQPEGSVVACVNPGLLTDNGKLDADLPSPGDSERTRGFTFVENPGLLSAKCTEASGNSFLAISVGRGAESHTLNATLKQFDGLLVGWGLHALDVNLALGNLVELVRAQAAAWTASSRPQTP